MQEAEHVIFLNIEDMTLFLRDLYNLAVCRGLPPYQYDLHPEMVGVRIPDVLLPGGLCSVSTSQSLRVFVLSLSLEIGETFSVGPTC